MFIGFLGYLFVVLKMTSLIKFVFRHKNLSNYSECKRFAGHSKWANIKHTKMEKDNERASALQSTINKMKIAIAEGKSSNPDDNNRLARLIEQAKKNSMPMATIKSFLEKAQKAKTGLQSAIFESRGPSGCVVLIQLLADNVTHTKHSLNTQLRKSQFSPAELPSQGQYIQKGIILTEVENRDIDKIIDDAIEIGAEDAEKCEENNKEFLQFICQPSELVKIKNKLEAMNYKVIQADVEYIPQVFVALKDEEMELVSKLYERLHTLEEVVKVYSNIS